MNNTPAFPLANFPFDIIEVILGGIETRRDLLSFATASSACKELVIPRHTEYRNLRIINNRPEIWQHLVQRSDLACNIREVVIVEVGSETRKRKPERFPITFVEKTPTQVNLDDVEVVTLILRVLGNMHDLQSFGWINPWNAQGLYRNVPNYQQDVFQTLKDCKSLAKLNIVDPTLPFDPPVPGPAENEAYPLWDIANLQALSLLEMRWWPTGLDALISKSPNLQSLEFDTPVDTVHFVQCRFPQLRKLQLTAMGIDDEPAIADFLKHHPTIEDLNWYPSTTSLHLEHGVLPHLKRLTSTPEFACSVLSDPTLRNRAVERVHKLLLTDATLAILGAIDTSHMRDLRFWSYRDLDSIHRLAEVCPQLTHLEIPKYGITARNDTQSNYTVDDYILALSKFPVLECFLDPSLWLVLRRSGKEKIERLAALCPKLERLVHSSTQKNAIVDIVLSRDGGKVSWKEETCFRDL
ncbi:hypothetical protein GGX14DRAFT_416748 [Mycena pura]|uniref:F-box domain-containing protein n=1 Tax=Mycena pura TaxID=153505 RepID=A0AAD6YU65_9AGAR|nr:hypothetical protein GGX14DRAFT_416748 [Mycena pura]